MSDPSQSSLAGVVVALDVDGVLLDASRGGKGKWSNELTARHGVDGNDLHAAFFRPYWSEIIVGARPIEPALELALHELQWKVSVEEVLTCWFEADFVVDRDVADAARHWHESGAEIVLTTNQEHRRMTYLRGALEGLVPFDAILYSADLGAQKRHVAFFRAAFERLGLGDRPRRVVLVDDDRANIEAARAFGWAVVHFTKAAGWRDEIDDALARAVAGTET